MKLINMEAILNKSKIRIVFLKPSKIEAAGIEALANSAKLGLWVESTYKDDDFAVYAYDLSALNKFIASIGLELTRTIE